ncbi:rab-GTPase-TBC domain-containing protein [Dichotomocladium elegans]|nr:rab-GTPase-TBC domain-containing protein [Dichotomocladium elegans]
MHQRIHYLSPLPIRLADFWKIFIDDPDTVFKTQAARVRHHMVAGVPAPLRGYLWQIMAKSRNNGELDSEYRELLKRISPHEKAIQRDLARTFPNMDFFREQGGKGQQSLFNVIKAYSLFDQQVGYCQGLPFIVGCLLLNMSDEMAFSVLVKMMSQYGMRSQFTPNMELLQERLYQFNHLLQEMLPQVYDHLVREGVDASMYVSQWLLTLFAYKCPIQLTFRVFDTFFLEGATVLLRFSLALMFRSQQTLLGLEFDSLVEFLNNDIFGVYEGDENGFIQDAYHIDLSPRVLARLSKQYHNGAAREAKAQSQEEQVRKTNVELSTKLRALEKTYQALEKDHREVVEQVIESKLHVAKVDAENQQLRCQLAQVRAEAAKLKSTITAGEDLQKRNAQLHARNHDLQDQVADLEAILSSVTLKYAECESAYEEMQQRLRETRTA